MGDYDAFAGPRACQLSELVLDVCPLVCLHDCHGLRYTWPFRDYTILYSALELNKQSTVSLFSPFTFERHLQPRDMSKVSSKTGQFESQRRVLFVSYFYLTSRLTNISFGHYKTGLHICVFFVQPTTRFHIFLLS